PAPQTRRVGGVGACRLEARARDWKEPFLVDRAWIFLRAVRLVRGAGSPDEVSRRGRIQPGSRRLGARAREPGRRAQPDRPRTPRRQDGARVGVAGWEPRIRALLRRAPRPPERADGGAALPY